MFAENLPPNCPPTNYQDKEILKAYRLVCSDSISKESFYSKAKLGEENTTNAGDCIFASCSLVLDALKQVERWPRLRDKYPFAAVMKIPKGSGISDGKENSNHINFWAYKSFDPMTAVIEVFQIPKESGNV